MEWGRFAIKSSSWQLTCEHSHTDHTVNDLKVEVVVAIAAPDGRVAVWYDHALTFATTPRTRNRSMSYCQAAHAATDCKAFAAYWDKRRTKGGDRDVRPLALAAGRVLHAQAFNETPTARDVLLSEFLVLTGADRPATQTLLKASDTALEAASVLIAIENYRGIHALLTGKGVTA
jgi:hypothetical protein